MMNILNLVVEEIKCSYKMIVLGIAIAMSVISVVVVFYNLTDYIMPAISNQYDSKFTEGVTAYIQRLKVDDVEILSKYGAKDIILNDNGSTQFERSVLKIDDKDIEVTQKCFKWFTEEDYYLGNIPKEIDWEKFNYSENAIIYCSEADRSKFEIGDVLSLYLKNGTFVGEFQVEAVVQDDEYSEPYAILPSVSVISKMDKSGIRIVYDFNCTILKSSQYIEFKKNIESYGAYCSSDFDDMLNLVSTLKLVFKILAIIFIVISVFVIVTFSIMIIHSREKFLVLQKALGAIDYKIVSIYLIILELQIFIADLIGCVVGIRFTKYLTNVVYSLYDMDHNIGSASYLWMVAISILISNIAVLPFIVIIKKVINHKDIVSVINNKD